MADDRRSPPLIYLVTPPAPDPAALPARLEAALATGRVAAVLIAPGASEEAAEALGQALVPIAQRHNAAALIAEHSRIAGRLGADGLHVSTGIADLRAAAAAFRPKRIVGAGNLPTRHAAMEAAEADIDYLFFGLPHGDIRPEPHPKALELARWAAELMQVPTVLMAGNALAELGAAARAGTDFIALNGAVWNHPGGPAEALEIAAQVVGAAFGAAT